jgi:hypothetical protein
MIFCTVIWCVHVHVYVHVRVRVRGSNVCRCAVMCLQVNMKRDRDGNGHGSLGTEKRMRREEGEPVPRRGGEEACQDGGKERQGGEADPATWDKWDAYASAVAGGEGGEEHSCNQSTMAILPGRETPPEAMQPQVTQPVPGRDVIPLAESSNGESVGCSLQVALDGGSDIAMTAAAAASSGATVAVADAVAAQPNLLVFSEPDGGSDMVRGASANAGKARRTIVTSAWPYDAREGDELSFKKGDQFAVLVKGEDRGWIYVQRLGGNAAGCMGLVPSTHLEAVTASWPREAQEEDELSFRQGDKLTILGLGEDEVMLHARLLCKYLCRVFDALLVLMERNMILSKPMLAGLAVCRVAA